MTKILVSRLQEYLTTVAPWGTGFRMFMVKRVRGRNPDPFSSAENHVTPRAWTGWDHARRIRSIMETAEWYDDPITLDNECGYGVIYPIPTLIDGWHRFFAHIACGDTHIRANYGGRMDLLRYLQGRRKTAPEY